MRRPYRFNGEFPLDANENDFFFQVPESLRALAILMYIAGMYIYKSKWLYVNYMGPIV